MPGHLDFFHQSTLSSSSLRAALFSCFTSLYWYLRLPPSSYQTLPWVLLNFRRFAQTHNSSLSPSGWNPTLPVLSSSLCSVLRSKDHVLQWRCQQSLESPPWPPLSLYLEICPGDSGRIRVTFLNTLCHQAGRGPGLSTPRLPARHLSLAELRQHTSLRGLESDSTTRE